MVLPQEQHQHDPIMFAGSIAGPVSCASWATVDFLIGGSNVKASDPGPTQSVTVLRQIVAAHGRNGGKSVLELVRHLQRMHFEASPERLWLLKRNVDSGERSGKV